MRNLIGILGISLLLTGCGGGTDVTDILSDQRPIEWWQAPWRGAFLDVALVHPDAAAGPGPHPVIMNLTWGDGSAVEAWAIGKVDTLDPAAETVLVDRWTWNNPAHGDAG